MNAAIRSIATALFLGLSFAAYASTPDAPSIEAKSWILVDADSGVVLASKNPEEQVEPASITKVLTTYVAFNALKEGKIKLSDEVRISEKAWRQGIDSSESRMFLDVGSRVKLEDLLHGVITQSGNDASVAIAEHIGGTEDAFVNIMNDTAKTLGMDKSHFANAMGMPDPAHFTTALDLSKLGRALIRDFPEFYPWFSRPEFTFHGIRQQNRNLLLKMDPTVDGIKTGHTDSAGYCLLSSAKRDNQRLIAAVMGTESTKYRAKASSQILEWGFRNFEDTLLLGEHNPISTIRIWKGTLNKVAVGTVRSVTITQPRGTTGNLEVKSALNKTLIAPLLKGQAVGTITITKDGKTVATEPLVVLEDVPAAGFFKRLFHSICLWFV